MELAALAPTEYLLCTWDSAENFSQSLVSVPKQPCEKRNYSPFTDEDISGTGHWVWRLGEEVWSQPPYTLPQGTGSWGFLDLIFPCPEFSTLLAVFV